MQRRWPSQSDGAKIPHHRLTPLQEGSDDPPAGYVPPLFSIHILGLPAPSGQDRVGMEAIGEIPQRLTWRSNPAHQRSDTCVVLDI